MARKRDAAQPAEQAFQAEQGVPAGTRQEGEQKAAFNLGM
jgi:hypothetical protein